MERLTVQVASIPDREEVVAEIWSGKNMVAELRRAGGQAFILEMYCSKSNEPWVFDLDSWVIALESAKKKLNGGAL